MSSPLETDGDPIELLSLESWERFLGIVGIIEGPWMLKRCGVYYLMYSGNATSSVDSAVGYATAVNPLGPFSKYAGNPVLTKGGVSSGRLTTRSWKRRREASSSSTTRNRHLASCGGVSVIAACASIP